MPEAVTRAALDEAEAEIVAACAPVDEYTLSLVMDRLLDWARRWDLWGSPHRLSNREAADWCNHAKADLTAALSGLPAAAVVEAAEDVMRTWRQGRLPLPGDLRAAVDTLPAWTATRGALARLRTARWALRRDGR